MTWMPQNCGPLEALGRRRKTCWNALMRFVSGITAGRTASFESSFSFQVQVGSKFQADGTTNVSICLVLTI